ncbi:MAG: hypothetical protein P0Y49_09870 [Candidatus Pedobacter colombiensis]|uniref:Beta-lactamase-inhibitor-like PepSY-like domain-containing protein n=1 Tax=Candidatus Pedobacter colombiensis TaxID=3121371 RepID=A0AAJ5WBJ8_9SPHI|nr:hypothetical protein [Pedobacter sp.]WEK21444.1 MAG: hypothetical protein P0Y49_09870 [Pedobacter sp.]
MKKLLILSAALVFLTAVGYAQNKEDSLKREIKMLKQEGPAGKPMERKDKRELRKLEGKEVSYQSKQKFAADFGNIPVTKWVRMDNYDRATFTKDGKVMNAFYDADNSLVGTTSYRPFSDLPENAQKYINDKYKDYKIDDKVLFFDDNEFNDTNMVLYNQEFDDADNYFLEVKKGNETIVLKIDAEGLVSFFKKL